MQPGHAAVAQVDQSVHAAVLATRAKQSRPAATGFVMQSFTRAQSASLEHAIALEQQVCAMQSRQ